MRNTLNKFILREAIRNAVNRHQRFIALERNRSIVARLKADGIFYTHPRIMFRGSKWNYAEIKT